MPIKVYIKPVNDGYQAVCPVFKFEVSAPTKDEASQRMNEKIRIRVEEMKAEGHRPPEPSKSCEASSNCANKGCGGDC